MSFIIVIYSARTLLHLRNKVIPVDFCSRAAGTYRDVGTSPLQSLSDKYIYPYSYQWGERFLLFRWPCVAADQ